MFSQGFQFSKTRKIDTAAGAGGYLDSVLSNVLFDVDATISDSYSGTGNDWLNLISAPSDGELQSAYDFQRGDGSTSTTFPTFNGTAGDQAAYWSFDGGDAFTIKNGNTATLNALHHDAANSPEVYTFITTIRLGATSVQALFSTSNDGNNTSEGVAGLIASSTLFGGNQWSDSTSTSASFRSSLSAVDTTTDYIIAIAFDDANNRGKVWVSSATGVEDTDVSWFTATGNPNGTNGFTIGSHSGLGALFLASGTRMYSAALVNSYLTDAQMADVIAHYNARHNRTYAAESDYLDGVVSSACCDLDASVGASYTSGETFSNLVVNPADGNLQTDYDFWLGSDGTTTNNPVFSTDKFTFETGDRMVCKTTNNILVQLHKDAVQWWAVCVFERPVTPITANLWGSSNSTSFEGGGIQIRDTDTDYRWVLSIGASFDVTDLGSSLHVSGYNILLITGDNDLTTNNIKVYANSTTPLTLSNTYTSTTNAAGFAIGGAYNVGGVIVDHSIKQFGAGNSFLSDGEAANIIAHLEARHSDDYTP